MKHELWLWAGLRKTLPPFRVSLSLTPPPPSVRHSCVPSLSYCRAQREVVSVGSYRQSERTQIWHVTGAVLTLAVTALFPRLVSCPSMSTAARTYGLDLPGEVTFGGCGKIRIRSAQICVDFTYWQANASQPGLQHGVLWHFENDFL